MSRTKEKYYICERCSILIKKSQILKSIENWGDMGMCDCEFTRPIWSRKYNTIDCETPRVYHQYTEISKKWYDDLGGVDNEALRLIRFNTIPKNKLLDKAKV